MNLINGAWWFGNLAWVTDEVIDLKYKIEDTTNPSTTGKDYVIVAGKTVTVGLDIVSLG